MRGTDIARTTVIEIGIGIATATVTGIESVE